jgi:type II secretory pathway pseudopilin PulG
MSWITVAAVGGSALLGAYTSSQTAKAQKEAKRSEMLANAAQMQYAPWTGAKIQTLGWGDANRSGTADAINGGLQGGLTGAMMASQFKGPPQQAQPEKAYDGKAMAGGNSPWEDMQRSKPNMYENQPGNPFDKKYT